MSLENNEYLPNFGGTRYSIYYLFFNPIPYDILSFSQLRGGGGGLPHTQESTVRII